MNMNTSRSNRTNNAWKHCPLVVKRCFGFGLVFLCTINSANSQERWFQIEVSVFTNESTTDRLEENWQAKRTNLGFPEGIRRLNEISDVLILDDFIPLAEENPIDAVPIPLESESLTLPVEETQPSREELILSALLAVKPQPRKPGEAFKFFDIQRADYLQLPAAQSDFSQTNRTLNRSPNHRLLWHGLWRQAVVQEEEAQAIFVSAGERYNGRHELEGSLTIRFNDNADRVVIDTNLWLTEYSRNLPPMTPENPIQEQDSWRLPSQLDEGFFTKQQLLNSSSELTLDTFNIERIYHMTESRAMRSNEFHYLDHPALGVVIMVNPYEVPDRTAPASIDATEPSLIQ